MVKEDLIENKLSENLFVKGVLFEFEVEVLDVGIIWLELLPMKLFEVGVLKGLLSAESLCRIITE